MLFCCLGISWTIFFTIRAACLLKLPSSSDMLLVKYSWADRLDPAATIIDQVFWNLISQTNEYLNWFFPCSKAAVVSSVRGKFYEKSLLYFYLDTESGDSGGDFCDSFESSLYWLKLFLDVFKLSSSSICCYSASLLENVSIKAGIFDKIIMAILSGTKLGFAFKHCMVRLVTQSRAVGSPLAFELSLLWTAMYQVVTFFSSLTLWGMSWANFPFCIVSFLNSILNSISSGKRPSFLI